MFCLGIKTKAFDCSTELLFFTVYWSTNIVAQAALQRSARQMLNTALSERENHVFSFHIFSFQPRWKVFTHCCNMTCFRKKHSQHWKLFSRSASSLTFYGAAAFYYQIFTCINQNATNVLKLCKAQHLFSALSVEEVWNSVYNALRQVSSLFNETSEQRRLPQTRWQQRFCVSSCYF